MSFQSVFKLTILLSMFTALQGTALHAMTRVSLLETTGSTLNGRTVTVLRRVSGEPSYEVVSEDIKFEGGKCNLNLENGQYTFEVFHSSSDDFVCVRSSEVSIGSEPVTVEMPTIKMRLGLKHDGEFLKIARVGVRTWGPMGENRRDVDFREAKDRVLIRTSPGAQLDLMVAGFSDEVIALAWKQVQGKSRPVTVRTQPEWERTIVEPNVQNPELHSAYVRVQYPAGYVTFPCLEPRLLVTNLSSIEFRYELNAESRRLVSQYATVNLSEHATLVLGGSLTAGAYARVMVFTQKDGDHLVQGAYLNDPSGRLIDLEESRIDWDAKPLFRGNRPLPENPINDISRGLIGNPEETLRFFVKWRWSNLHRRETLQAMPMKKFESANFSLEAPPGWRDRASVYLAILERTQAVLVQQTGKRPAVNTRVAWQVNGHSARGIRNGVGGWMRMPYAGLKQATDPYGQKPLLIHEMCHTLGFGHGAKMNAAIKQAKLTTMRQRWLVPYEEYLDEAAMVDVPTENINKDLSTIKFVSAKFGAGKKWVDVSKQVESAIRTDRKILVVSSTGLGVREQAPKGKKELVIIYELEGVRKSKTISSSPNKKMSLYEIFRR